MCKHDISISIVGFGDQARVCRMDQKQTTSRQKQIRHPSTKVSLLFDELSDNTSSDGLL